MAHSSTWRHRRFGQAPRHPHKAAHHGAPNRDTAPSRPAPTGAEPPSCGDDNDDHTAEAGYPQPLKGFDYSFGAVG
ncbi:MAG: hypothetical protein KF891_22715 [Rhizobacter sp.]|nr:hypothetical protein [Rhizobacter sp.]